MLFENSGVGKCILLKESNSLHSLVYAYEKNEFIVVSALNKTTGNWGSGCYFDEDLDQALAFFNKANEEIKKEEQER